MYYKVEKMNDNVLMWILGGLFGGLLTCFGLTNKKLDKKEFEDHCHKSEKLDSDITEMKLDIREIKTILKDLK